MPTVTSESTETIRASIVAVGAVDRPTVSLPDGTISEGVVRVDADETTYHAPITRGLSGDLELSGLYENARLARTQDGTNHFPSWVERHGLDIDRSVLLDVILEGTQYGLRAPGNRAVYEIIDAPDDSLASIADNLDS